LPWASAFSAEAQGSGCHWPTLLLTSSWYQFSGNPLYIMGPDKGWRLEEGSGILDLSQRDKF